MNRTIEIKTPEQVEKINRLACEAPYEVWLSTDTLMLDARSLLGLMALVGLMSYRSDLHLASQNLTDATQYVKQQRTAYDRFNDTSVTKSLLRVIENVQQIDREIQYKIALTGEATLNTDDLRRYTYEQRLTGIILMNEHGVVQREYSTDGPSLSKQQNNSKYHPQVNLYQHANLLFRKHSQKSVGHACGPPLACVVPPQEQGAPDDRQVPPPGI